MDLKDKKQDNRTKEPSDTLLKEEQTRYKGEIYFSNPPKSTSGQTVAAKNKKGRKVSYKVLVYLVFISVFTAVLTLTALACVNDVLAINRSKEIVTVNIPEGATTKDILKILDENGLIKQRIFCGVFMNFVTKVKDTKEPTYLNGIYYVRADMGVEALLNEFKSTQTAAKTVKLVFPEGWTIYQIISKLAENNVSKSEYLYAALSETKFNYSFVSSIPDSEKRTQRLEGYFFPDTYEFFVNENANSVMNRLISNFDTKWTESYSKKAQSLGMSTDQIIIIASIIQKEAANADQMGLVSSVIHNRIEKKSVYPALECNATKDYITRFVKPVIGEAKANVYFEAYNTYMTPGLPPGPICNPGIKAIEAALNPSQTDYYYFQHDKFGKIYMAKTVKEQNDNTMEVLRVNNR
jgi:UPF0755 protein